MKHKLQTLLKHKLGILLTLSAFLCVSNVVLGESRSSIYVLLDRDYSDPHIHTWGGTSTEWPGPSLGSIVDGVTGLYYYDITGTEGSFSSCKISNNGGEPQSDNISIGSGNLVAVNGNTYSYSSGVTPVTTFKVKKSGLFSSSAPYIHCWSRSDFPDTAWPGFTMVADPNNSEWWTITILGTAPGNILFHDNSGKQTPDITVGDNRCYSVSDTEEGSKYPSTVETCPTTCIDPDAKTVSGGGNICPDESATITLSGSESGYTYELYLGGSATGTTLSGSGSSLSFTGVTDAGTYTVYGYMSGCTPVQMSGSVTVSSKGVTISSIDPDPSSETIHEYEPTTITASGSATWSITSVPSGITSGTDAYLSTTSGTSTVFKGAKGTSGSYTVRATADGCNTDTTFSVDEWDDDCE